MAGDHARLPSRGAGPLLHPALAGLWLRPWFDAFALRFIADWQMPMARALATALAVDGEPETFAPSPPTPEAAIAAEVARRSAAERMMLSQTRFLPLVARGAVAPLGWDVASQEEMHARHGARLEGLAFPAPAPGEVRRSHSLLGPDGAQYWLRMPAPSPLLDDEAWAHVYEPAGVENPATLVFLHGICMELEFWPDRFDPIPRLARRGIRVLRVEGPWHGRRRAAGRFGGEPILARGPLGMVELFEAWASEAALWIEWARRAGSGPVALAGVSLGALTSQLAATAARDWPAAMRPDALLLVVTTGDLGAIITESDLPARLGLPARIAEEGWTAQTIRPWLALVEPGPAPAPAPGNIVMLLGEVDRVAPFAGGLALADRWRVPAANRFLQRRGHFSASLSMGFDPRPIERLLEILARRGARLTGPDGGYPVV